MGVPLGVERDEWEDDAEPVADVSLCEPLHQLRCEL